MEAAMTELAVGNGIVVGIDGSEASREALRWATRQAHALHTDVVAVHAWEQARPRFAPYAPASARPTAAEQQEKAAHLLASTLRDVFGAQVDSAVHAFVVEGPPARVLLQRARGALLLALGRTPRDHYDQPATGPVARACLRQATLPVVTVPAPRRPSSQPITVGAPFTARRGAAQQPAGARELRPPSVSRR